MVERSISNDIQVMLDKPISEEKLNRINTALTSH